MNTKISSIRNKFILYFAVFSLSIFIVLWIMQVVFIQAYYRTMIKNEVIKLGKNVEASYNETNILDEVAFKNSLSILIFDSNGNVKYSSNSTYKPLYIDLSKAMNELVKSNTYYATYTVKIDKINSESLIYVSKIDDAYIVISTNIEPIGAATKVLANQLIYITIILLLLSCILSVYISNRLIKPIKNITENAKELGKGNYDIIFESSEYEELNSLANTLNYSAKEFKKTDNLRKELIANVSHDIKTPLTIIKAYSEMIKDLSGDIKEKRDEHLNVIINQADLLTKLVNDMMDLSKLETGTYILNIEEFDMVDIINDVTYGFKYLDDYNFVINTEKECIVKADKIKISQVLYNLISNAVNYVGSDKTIYINLLSKKDSVKVEIKDNGKGIEDTTHIFDRYYKSNDKFRKSGFGTGLGLSIVKNILELHKFNYGVNSKVGSGTTFWFEIK